MWTLAQGVQAGSARHPTLRVDFAQMETAGQEPAARSSVAVAPEFLGHSQQDRLSENGLLSLTKAARHFGLNRHSLADAAKRGLVRSRRIEPPGLGRNGVGFLFDELQEDLERLPTCRYDGCDRPALGSSGGCEAHGHVFAGARAQGVKRPDIGPAISAAKTGKPRPDWSERLRQLHIEQGHSPPEERSCKRCGRYIGLVYVSKGRRFCTPSCVMLWRRENEPESFNLRHGGQGGQGAEFLCAICRHRTVVRWPSQVAAAGGEQKARFICSTCDPLWRSAVMRARAVLGVAVDKGHVNPRAASFANGAQEPFRSAAAVAKTFAEAVRAAAQDKRGRRPPAAADLLIEAAHREGFTDRLVADALNWLLDEGELVIPGLANGHVFDVKYVETRRDRAGIKRGARAA